MSCVVGVEVAQGVGQFISCHKQANVAALVHRVTHASLGSGELFDGSARTSSR